MPRRTQPLRLPQAPLQAFSFSDEQRAQIRDGRDVCDLIGSSDNPAKLTRSKQPKEQSEFYLQCSAVKQLRAILPLDYIVASHCSERASMVEGSKSKLQGQMKGWPDTEICGDGKTWRIEWKNATGRVSCDQERVHGLLRQAGQMIAVCRSIEDAVGFLRVHGARFRGAISA